MADELELTINMRLLDNELGVDFSKNITSAQFDWLSSNYATGMREIATGSAQQLASDYTFTGPLLLFVRNTTADGTTPEPYVEIRYSSGGTTVAATLYGNQPNLISIDDSEVYAQAYNDSVNLEFVIIDDVT